MLVGNFLYVGEGRGVVEKFSRGSIFFSHIFYIFGRGLKKFHINFNFDDGLDSILPLGYTPDTSF